MQFVFFCNVLILKTLTSSVPFLFRWTGTFVLIGGTIKAQTPKIENAKCVKTSKRQQQHY